MGYVTGTAEARLHALFGISMGWMGVVSRPPLRIVGAVRVGGGREGEGVGWTVLQGFFTLETSEPVRETVTQHKEASFCPELARVIQPREIARSRPRDDPNPFCCVYGPMSASGRRKFLERLQSWPERVRVKALAAAACF